MPFKKGDIGNPNGRPKGSTNKISAEYRDYLRHLLLSKKKKQKLEEELNKLTGRDYLKFYIALMQYIIPKPATAELKEVPELEEFIAMTPEERQTVIEEIQESIKNETPINENE
jgi:Family of unknown function (DUF5681)